MEKNRIGIDARMINSLGIGSYLRGLLSCLPEIQGSDYILFGDPDELSDFPFRKIEFKENIYSIKEQLRFPYLLKKERIDLLHSPHYNIPLFASLKKITTIHDIIHMIFPSYLSSRLAYFYSKYMISRALSSSEIIITDSENSKKDITGFFKFNPEKIRVIHLGVDDKLQYSSEKEAKALSKYGKYVLYVGALRPHKNIKNMIEAYNIAVKEKNIKEKLILVGRRKQPYFKEVSDLILSLGLEDKVDIYEDVDKEELVMLYCGCRLFLFVSEYEGFGLPPLEAMSFRKPVIASKKASLPEVLGDAACYADSSDPKDVSEKIYMMLHDEARRKIFSLRGYERSSKYKWSSASEKTAALYKEILT